MKKAKKVAALFCALMIVTTLIPTTFAVETKEEFIDLGDGFYAVVTFEQTPMSHAGDTVSGNKTGKVYQGSVLVGTATMGATFDISGATAKAKSANVTGTGSNGWSYDHGTTSLSGNKASGTAYFKKDGVQKSFALTITCSPDGTLS